MAIVRKKDGIPNYAEIREMVEQEKLDEMMHDAFFDPSNFEKNFEKLITIIPWNTIYEDDYEDEYEEEDD